MSSYAQKLRDPRWQKKRLEVLEAAGWKCELCGDSENTLHVHHKQYFRGREPWDYAGDQLAALCECCHESMHESDDLLRDVISRVDLARRDEIAWLISGYLGRGYDPASPRELAFARVGVEARKLSHSVLENTSETDLAAWVAAQIKKEV